MNQKQVQNAFDIGLAGLQFSQENQRRVFAAVKRERVGKRLSLALVLAIVLTLAATVALAASVFTAYYERVGFVDNPAYAKWSIWVGGDAFLSELDRIDALVEQLSDGLYEEDAILDAAARANPEVNASEKKALRTALYSFWKVADPVFFSLDTFEPFRYEASVAYQESSGIGTWHVRLNPAKDAGLPFYYAEVSAMNNQLIRIHKLSEDGTKTLKVIYFGAVEVDYDEFVSRGQFG